MTKLYEKRKYVRKSTKNYNDHIRYIVIYFSVCPSTTPLLKLLLPLQESNNKIKDGVMRRPHKIVSYSIVKKKNMTCNLQNLKKR